MRKVEQEVYKKVLSGTEIVDVMVYGKPVTDHMLHCSLIEFYDTYDPRGFDGVFAEALIDSLKEAIDNNDNVN